MAMGTGLAGLRSGFSLASARVTANDRIVVGCIGVGGMGRSHFDRLLVNEQVHVVAVADPDGRRRQSAREAALQAGVRIAAYNDFREMLARPDIDAVFVATPDHWHALASIAAMEAGKDVYCEKPLALTVAEGRAMVDTARRFGRVVQMGTQQRSDDFFRHACELVRNGRIGDVRKVRTFIGPNPQSAYVSNETPPAYLDWDLWLGPAPWRPFNRTIHPYSFRYYRDYSGGLLTDWGVHLNDIAQWGCNKDTTGPRRVEAQGLLYEDNQYEFPKSMRVQWDYGDVVFEWVQDTPEALDAIEPGAGYGTKFYGSDADLFVNRKGYVLQPRNGQTIDETIGEHDIQLYRSPGHRDDFFQCMRTRNAPICDVAIGHRTTTLSHLGNIAFQLGRPLEFDPEKEAFVNDEAANRLLDRPMRTPWHL